LARASSIACSVFLRQCQAKRSPTTIRTSRSTRCRHLEPVLRVQAIGCQVPRQGPDHQAETAEEDPPGRAFQAAITGHGDTREREGEGHEEAAGLFERDEDAMRIVLCPDLEPGRLAQQDARLDDAQLDEMVRRRGSPGYIHRKSPGIVAAMAVYGYPMQSDGQ
jgi:hypothetical protein